MQLQIQYTPVKLRPHVYVLKKPGKFHAQEAAECHQEGGEPHQTLARGAVHIIGHFRDRNCIN